MAACQAVGASGGVGEACQTPSPRGGGQIWPIPLLHQASCGPVRGCACIGVNECAHLDLHGWVRGRRCADIHPRAAGTRPCLRHPRPQPLPEAMAEGAVRIDKGRPGTEASCWKRVPRRTPSQLRPRPPRHIILRAGGSLGGGVLHNRKTTCTGGPAPSRLVALD